MQRIFIIGDFFSNSSFDIVHNHLYKQLNRYVAKEGFIFINKAFVTQVKEKTFYTLILKIIINWIKIIYLFFSLKKKDILFVTNSASPLFKLLALKRNKKIVLHLDLFYLEYSKKQSNFFNKILTYGYFNLWHTISIKAYDKIICISEHSKNELINHIPTTKDKTQAIDLGIESDTFRQKTYSSRIISQPYILYVGLEFERKNLSNSIKAFSLLKKEFPNLVFLKIGKGPSMALRNKTLEYVHNNGLRLEKDFIILEDIPIERIVQAYNQAELLLFPSLQEGFGFPLIESIACGCIPITSNLPPMNAIIPNKELLVNPHNPLEIAEKSKEILKNTELRKKLQNTLLLHSKKYTWSNICKKYSLMFHTLITSC